MEEKIDIIHESDRGTVIIGCDILDNKLTELLSQVFKKNRIPNKITKDMYNFNGPLGTFSSKISICYSFGLIDRLMYNDLNKIRKMRNMFSHSHEFIDFNDKSIGVILDDIIVCLEAKDIMKNIKRYSYVESDNETPKNDAVNKYFKEAKILSEGYVKYHKCIFCLGFSIMRSNLNFLIKRINDAI
jgi:DNA-binding MltR family transcriptional regulator